VPRDFGCCDCVDEQRRHRGRERVRRAPPGRRADSICCSKLLALTGGSEPDAHHWILAGAGGLLGNNTRALIRDFSRWTNRLRAAGDDSRHQSERRQSAGNGKHQSSETGVRAHPIPPCAWSPSWDRAGVAPAQAPTPGKVHPFCWRSPPALQVKTTSQIRRKSDSVAQGSVGSSGLKPTSFARLGAGSDRCVTSEQQRRSAGKICLFAATVAGGLQQFGIAWQYDASRSSGHGGLQ
jgi:hypothetical protein